MSVRDPVFGVVLLVLLFGLGSIVGAVVVRMRMVERRERFDRKEKTRRSDPR